MNTKYILGLLFLMLASALMACGTAAPTSEAEPTTAPPTAVPATATPEPTLDPASVVQEFWDALAAGNIEAAMTFVADEAKCRGSCYFTGKQSFRAYLQGMLDSGATTNISDLKVEGDTVKYLYKVVRNEVVVEDNAEGESMQVLGGKIIFWNNLHF